MRTKEIVDNLGKLRARIAELAQIEKEWTQKLKAKGEGVKTGKLFEANVHWSHRPVTDWEGVVREAKVPIRVVRKHTKKTDFLVCSVTARIPYRRKRAA